ncbi:MAG: hypothetical protein GWO82_07715 [Bacteroidetes bacterium]|nr:hypothetical protein [Bacteroidota bacterium]
MRTFFFSIMLIAVSCTSPKPQANTQNVVNSAYADSIIASIDVVIPPSIDALNLSNFVQLMESLNTIPFEQRQVTLKSIEDEAKTVFSQAWPDVLNTNPIRSRYTVFLTDTHVAADNRLGQNAAAQQAEAIVKMKKSWNIFISQISAQESSAVLETAPR